MAMATVNNYKWVFEAAELFVPRIRLFGAIDNIKKAFSKYLSDEKVFKEVDDMLGNPDISITLKSKISKMAGSPALEVAYISLARKTEKLIRYTLYYVTTHNAPKIKLSKKEREFVNTVAYYIGYGTIYNYDGVNDIQDYDIEHNFGTFNKDFLLMLRELRDIISKESFEAKWKAKLAAESILDTSVAMLGVNDGSIVNSTIDENGMITPIFFTTNSEVANIITPKRPSYMDDDTFVKFENAFKGILSDNYYYTRNNDGCWVLNIYNPNSIIENSYIIDDGSIMGGNVVSILGNYQMSTGYIDTIFVNVSTHKDIVGNILSSPFYTLTNDELHAVSKDMFDNCKIYRTIDFSNTGEIMNMVDLVNNGKDTFGRYLSGVLSILEAKGIDARLRFSEFASPTSFVLVSDDKCSSPLPGSTSTTIIPDLKVLVTTNKMILVNNGTSEEFTVTRKE